MPRKKSAQDFFRDRRNKGLVQCTEGITNLVAFKKVDNKTTA